MANEIFFDRKHNVAIVKTEQSIEDFKQSTLDEFHIVQKKTRIAFLELEIQKIKNGVTKASSQEVLNDVLSRYEKELAELKKTEQ
ncbi:hypothetical protein ACXVWQ_08010 [Haemophilus sp. SZY H57]|jgi:hypothetical protein|uniref:hypothetical protein n=1 Tax=Haemophilus parainfluenzae TaxID=729 RepID=UPI0018A52CBE|nr:hypothetical protein [Haemophilus parainfluenzae]QOR12684.1 hypothetical protein INP97_09475 [Haemophilus parainfluenzae]